MTRGLLERLRSGDRRALSRLITHVEDQTDLGLEALRKLKPAGEPAHVVGITGPPGAGKSTLVNALIGEYRDRGLTIGVIVIDPSSALTGGATLGDRIRMLERGDDPGVYIRSMATRGQVGGLSVAVFGALELINVFGFDLILIETVGVGQDEVDVASMADTVVVLQTAGSGDGVQIIKAGILEIGDIFVVNKADMEGSRDVSRQLRQLIQSNSAGDSEKSVVSTIATSGDGVSDLADAIEGRYSALRAQGDYVHRQIARKVAHARAIALQKLDTTLRTEIERQITGQDAEMIDAVELADAAISKLKQLPQK